MSWYDKDGMLHESDEDDEQDEIIEHMDYITEFTPDFDLSEDGIQDAAQLSDNTGQLDADIINPSYYKQGNLECIDAIEGLNLPFHEAQILKYITRWRLKGGVSDILKAKWYLERLLNRATKEE